MSGGLFSKRIQSLLIDGGIMFGVVPIAFTPLSHNWIQLVDSPNNNIYYIFAILGVALLAFERLARQVRAGMTK
jgi:hypothetical protein